MGDRYMQDRIFQADDGQWYYRVRSNQDAGPFASRAVAQRKLDKQMRMWTGFGPLANWKRALQSNKVMRRSATRQT